MENLDARLMCKVGPVGLVGLVGAVGGGVQRVESLGIAVAFE